MDRVRDGFLGGDGFGDPGGFERFFDEVCDAAVFGVGKICVWFAKFFKGVDATGDGAAGGDVGGEGEGELGGFFWDRKNGSERVNVGVKIGGKGEGGAGEEVTNVIAPTVAVGSVGKELNAVDA